MYHPEYKKALEIIKDLHKDFYYPRIDVQKKDLLLAVYYLSGGCISQVHFSLNAWEVGDLNTIMRTKRFIDEAKLLIVSLIAVQKRDRYLRRFFIDEIVTIDLKKHKAEFLQVMGMDEGDFEEWLSNAESIRHGFSKGVHPNLTSLAFNTDSVTGEYDYEAKTFAYHRINGFDFANFIIIPAIDAVILPSVLFGVDSKKIEEIREIREKIQIIAVEQHLINSLEL